MAPEIPEVIQLVLQDGAAAAGVSPHDRGLHFGDGVFETIACRAGRPRFLSLHLERLSLGCARLGLNCAPPELLRAEVESLAQGCERALIKLLVTRGTAVARGYATTGQERTTRLTFRYAWPHLDPAAARDGVQVRTADLRLGENPSLAGLKHCNRLEQILARREWSDPAIFESLLFSSSGTLVGGTMTNVFVVQEGKLLTPLVERCGVAGVMRHVVMREARRAGLEVQECALNIEAVRACTEMFVTNARVGVLPVRAWDGQSLPVGPLTRQLQACVEPLLEEPVDA